MDSDTKRHVLKVSFAFIVGGADTRFSHDGEADISLFEQLSWMSLPEPKMYHYIFNPHF